MRLETYSTASISHTQDISFGGSDAFLCPGTFAIFSLHLWYVHRDVLAIRKWREKIASVPGHKNASLLGGFLIRFINRVYVRVRICICLFLFSLLFPSFPSYSLSSSLLFSLSRLEIT